MNRINGIGNAKQTEGKQEEDESKRKQRKELSTDFALPQIWGRQKDVPTNRMNYTQGEAQLSTLPSICVICEICG